MILVSGSPVLISGFLSVSAVSLIKYVVCKQSSDLGILVSQPSFRTKGVVRVIGVVSNRLGKKSYKFGFFQFLFLCKNRHFAVRHWGKVGIISESSHCYS